MHNRKLRNKNTNFLKFKNSWGGGEEEKRQRKKKRKLETLVTCFKQTKL